MSETAQRRANRVIVIGAQGVLGRLLVDAFAAAGWSVGRAGRRPDGGDGYRHVDLAEPETVARAVGDADLVVNTVPDEQLVAARVVLERGGRLVDVSAVAEDAVRRLRDEDTPARGTVLLNAGIAPGLTNVVAADLLARHPEADEVELVFTVSTRGSHGVAGGGFAHRGLTSTGRHRTAVFALPEPYGRRRCLGFAERDEGWLDPRLLAGRTVSPYVCVAERTRARGLLAMNASGLIGRLPRSAFAGGPEHATDEPVRHWVGVRRHGEPLAARTIRCNGDYRAAAACAVLFGEALFGEALLARPARPTDPGRARMGSLVPEELVSLDGLRRGLDRAGIQVVDVPLDIAARAA
jgi:NAD(P)-dependent dehydrogenase (short-subunit alcohol dehydrogenase family)